jgi:hypothetical protein
MTANSELNREMLRHITASLAYRATKTFRGAPDTFGDFRVDEKSRSSTEILAHMGDLFDWAISMLKGKEIWHDSHPQNWNSEVTRFLNSLQMFDKYLADNEPIACSPYRIFQGPVADAFTHTGQLAMLRRLSGSPIRGENYFAADIKIGEVGLEQSMPRKEFD